MLTWWFYLALALALGEREDQVGKVVVGRATMLVLCRAMVYIQRVSGVAPNNSKMRCFDGEGARGNWLLY